MNELSSRIRTPVRRQGASRYLLITLLSFAASVTLTRMFLALTGYPQLGGGTLHIAHVLWGGLFLFLAALLPLVVANRWAFTLGAVGAGIGTGLFIDEVGKFITAGNDYFYPPAAPIIYVFFLLTVLVYLQVRRPPSRDPRAAFYRAFDGMQEVLDHDLDPEEHAELTAQLQAIAEETRNSNLSRLAEELLHFLTHDRLELAPPRSGLATRARKAYLRLEETLFSRNRARMILAGGGAALGALQLAGLVNVALALGASVRIEQLMSGWILNSYVSSKAALGWFLLRLALEAAAGTILLTAAILLILRRDRFALSLNILGLLLTLAGINLLEFYFDQFSAILPAAVQFLLLLGTLRYRNKFLAPEGKNAGEGGTHAAGKPDGPKRAPPRKKSTPRKG